MIYNQQRNEFIVRKGTHLRQFRTGRNRPAKGTVGLLRHAGRQVTIGDTTYKLDEPFPVLATQNPLEQEGTYPLPEAQVDRFIMKVMVGYPRKEEEQMIIRQNVQGSPRSRYARWYPSRK